MSSFLPKIFFVLLLSVASQFLSAQNSSMWITIHPNSGSERQIDEDLIINNGFLIENSSSNTINCIQSTNGDNLVYSITSSGSDIDKDGTNDEVSFDLIVKGYVNATYNYSANANASSVTSYGNQAGVTVIDNSWGVFGDFDVDAGESLIYEIENVLINGVSNGVDFNTSFTNGDFIEPFGGRDHTMIFGFGDSLASLEIDSNKSISLSDDDLFSVTGAGSFFANDREWSVTSLTFKIEINGPETVTDLSDYSWIEKGPTYYHDYPVQTVQKPTLPKFSWNKIPRWVAARNIQAFSDEQIEDIAENYQLIMLEKANNQGLEYIEDGIENAATRIKALNPDLTTLFYYNTYINYGGYRANAEYEQNAAEWSTYEDGSIWLFKDLYYWYNQDEKGMRDWWVDTCLKMAELDVIDGVFIDKVVNPDDNGDVLNSNGNPVNNYARMIKDLYDQLPSDKLLVGNTLRNERAGGSRGLMEIMDGSYLERWDFPSREDNQSDAEAVAVSIQMMREALAKGKMINFQTSPGSSTEEEVPEDDAGILEYTRENVYFPMAVFLIIAEENAYFSYSNGVNAARNSSDIWDTSFIEEFGYFLGEPLGDPTKEGYLYRRSFENLDVWVNVETKETGFTWKGKTESTTEVETITNEGTLVRITKRNATGFTIDGGNGGSNGQNITLSAVDESDEGQLWVEIDRGNGFYSYEKYGTNYSIDGNNGGAINQIIYLWRTDDDNQNQQWQKEEQGDGSYKLIKRNATEYTINGGSGGVEGRNISLWNSNVNHRNLQWYITPVATDVRLEAEDFDAMSGIQTEESTESGENVGFIHNGDWLRFDDVNLSGITNMDARVSSKFSGGTIEVRLGSASGTLIGSAEVSDTGGDQNWVTVNAAIDNTNGVHDVYLTFKGGNGYLFNVNWIEFNTNSNSRNNKSVNEISEESASDIVIYPNPVEDFFQINTENILSVEVYSMSGEVLKSFNGSETGYTVSDLSAGVYMVKIITTNGRLSMDKLIKL